MHVSVRPGVARGLPRRRCDGEDRYEFVERIFTKRIAELSKRRRQQHERKLLQCAADADRVGHKSHAASHSAIIFVVGGRASRVDSARHRRRAVRRRVRRRRRRAFVSPPPPPPTERDRIHEDLNEYDAMYIGVVLFSIQFIIHIFQSFIRPTETNASSNSRVERICTRCICLVSSTRREK